MQWYFEVAYKTGRSYMFDGTCSVNPKTREAFPKEEIQGLIDLVRWTAKQKEGIAQIQTFTNIGSGQVIQIMDFQSVEDREYQLKILKRPKRQVNFANIQIIVSPNS